MASGAPPDVVSGALFDYYKVTINLFINKDVWST